MRLATVFSGIGAIEQALKRLDVHHDIVFACDNGDVSLDIDYEQEMNKVRKLKNTIDKKEYVDNLYCTLTRKTNFVKISYLANYTINDNYFFNDVKLLDGRDFKNQVDLFVGGSPCQSFSAIGARGGFEDTRGTLFFEYARLIKEIQPKVFIYENVYGVLTHDKGQTWKVMQNVFTQLGYHYKYKILDARDYGIPQGRRRLFVVGFKEFSDCERFSFPEPIKLEYTMQDFLLENVKEGNFISVDGKIKLIREGQEAPADCFLSDKLKAYVLSPGTKRFMHADAKIDLPIARAILSTQGNSHRSSVNNYVTSNGRIRALHPRESHRLMGFPDDYQIVVSKAQAYKQSGNSIVVDVLMAIYKCIEKVLEG